MLTPPIDITVTLPRPHDAQQRIIDEAARFNVVDCGRRFGKTTLGQDRAAEPDVIPHPVGWFSPSYKMMLEVWRELALTLQPITKRKNVQERRIENIAGGVLEFWSLDKPDAARGRKYRRVIIDEAAMVPDLMDAWQHVIRPALADFKGDAWILSTPKGRNGFWQMYQWGEDEQRPEWACWQMPTSANPYIAESEIQAMYETMPERIYLQEIMAQFLDDAGGVFRRVMEAATAEEQDRAIIARHPYVFGVDWGKHNDFTVITVIDVASRSLVHMDRFRELDYRFQRRRLDALYEKFEPVTVVAEDTGIGDAIVDELQREGMRVTRFHTSNATKAAAIEGLALAFEQDRIKILNDPILIGELQAFEVDKTPRGNITYSAPDGMHDDCVMSLAFAWTMAQHTPAPLTVTQEPSRWRPVAASGNGDGGGRWKKF